MHRLAIMFDQTWNLEDMSEGVGLDVSHLSHTPLRVNACCPPVVRAPRNNRMRSSCVEKGECSGHGQYPSCLLQFVIR